MTPAAIQKQLWDVSLEELKEGECRGPFTADQLDDRHPEGWLAAERFAVEQKGKVRPCDNYAEFVHNCTSSSEETIDTDGPDAIVSGGRLWVGGLREDRKVFFRLSNGSTLEGTLHTSLTPELVELLKARLIDLKRAYKQLANNPRDAPFAIFGLKDPDGNWVFFEALVLGFGSRNAVMGFNLMARALRFIMNLGLLVPVTHFFDDFSQVEPEPFSDSNCECVQWLLNLLGWQYKDGPEDLLPPSSCFTPLGVQLDFSHRGWVKVSNTAKRLAKIQSETTRLIDLPKIPHHDVESLVGVCQFAEAQTSGRSGALVLQQVRRALAGSAQSDFSELKARLSDLAEYSAAVAPRWIKLRRTNRPILIFTDAAADPGRVTVGGVLFDPERDVVEYFGAILAEETTAPWFAEDKEQVICQAELLAVPVAFCTWAHYLADRDAIVFVDNEPAKDALIHGISASAASSRMVRFSRLFCARNAVGAWYERVASPSNIGDAPSRGRFDEMSRIGASQVTPVSPALEDPVVMRPFAVT